MLYLYSYSVWYFVCSVCFFFIPLVCFYRISFGSPQLPTELGETSCVVFYLFYV